MILDHMCEGHIRTSCIIPALCDLAPEIVLCIRVPTINQLKYHLCLENIACRCSLKGNIAVSFALCINSLSTAPLCNVSNSVLVAVLKLIHKGCSGKRGIRKKEIVVLTQTWSQPSMNTVLKGIQ